MAAKAIQVEIGGFQRSRADAGVVQQGLGRWVIFNVLMLHPQTEGG
jgi:hypothetical protein